MLFTRRSTDTVFTWLNAAATISPVTKIDAATIQGRLLIEVRRLTK